MLDKVLLDYHTMLDLVNELEESLPSEYVDAQRMLEETAAHVRSERRRVEEERQNARAEAAQVLEQASLHAQALASDHEIARRAEERSAEMIRNAEAYAQNLRNEAEAYAAELRRAADEYSETSRRGADEYAFNLLNHLRSVVTRATASVEEGLQQLQNRR